MVNKKKVKRLKIQSIKTKKTTKINNRKESALENGVARCVLYEGNKNRRRWFSE